MTKTASALRAPLVRGNINYSVPKCPRYDLETKIEKQEKIVERIQSVKNRSEQWSEKQEHQLETQEAELAALRYELAELTLRVEMADDCTFIVYKGFDLEQVVELTDCFVKAVSEFTVEELAVHVFLARLSLNSLSKNPLACTYSARDEVKHWEGLLLNRGGYAVIGEAA